MMKIENKTFGIGIVLVVLAALGFLMYALSAEAHGIHFTRHMYDENEQCHEATSHSFVLPQGWSWGGCPEETPEPSESPEPSETPEPTETPTPTPSDTPEPTSEPTDTPAGRGDESSTQDTNCADLASLTPDQIRGDCGEEPPVKGEATVTSTQTLEVVMEPKPVEKLETFPSTGYSWF